MRVERLSLAVRISFTGWSLLAACALAQEPLETVEVIGQTPLGAGLDADKVASNVQSATADELRAQRALDLTDFMKRNLAGVFVNEAQNNPLQPDVQYRGFVGSPLLGLPQGIAVYQDGVRVNEPFGDTVNWALIPESAIDTVYLIPGSNPLFGLNALGGAIAIETKTGFTHPGTRAELYGGSFSRVGLQAETGGVIDDRLSYFVTGSYLEEDGWRDFSPTEAAQLFGNLGWQSARTSLDVNVTLTDTDLIGNGPAPLELLEMDRTAIFTRPDRTENALSLVNLFVEHEVSSSWTLTGNLYLRESDIDTLNGDDSEFEACEDDPAFFCEEHDNGAGDELVLDANGNPILVRDELEGSTINHSDTRQDGKGFGLQATWTGDWRGRDNTLLVGFAYDSSDIGFDAGTELGALDSTRLAVPGGVFAGDSFIRLVADTSNTGLYLSNTLSVSERIALTVSGRFNRAEIRLADQLGTALNGDHEFDRFNPALGITVAVSAALTLYAGFNESNRAPSPVELTCADEDDPCRLPNAFLADPPLKQVVAKTLELGARGRWEQGAWHAGLFRTTNEDDILFVSAGALTNQGFFDNVGRTRRDGMELDLDGEVGDALSWFVNYTYLDATFREQLAFPSVNNPAAIDGEVLVAPGDELPLIPGQLLKAGLRFAIGARLSIGGDILAGDDFHMRGDEGNDVDPIGRYAVLNLRGDYAVNDRLRVFLNVDNLLDQDYETFGLFGEADEVLGDGFEDARFYSPAAPRAAWLGVQVEF